MNLDTYSKYVLAVITALQVIGMVVFLILWNYLGPKSLPLSIILMFAIGVVALELLQRLTVHDKKGRRVSSNIFGEAFFDIIALTVWTGLISVVLVVIGIIASYLIAGKKGYNRVLTVLVPFLAVGTFYASLAVAGAMRK